MRYDKIDGRRGKIFLIIALSPLVFCLGAVVTGSEVGYLIGTVCLCLSLAIVVCGAVWSAGVSTGRKDRDRL